MSARNEAEATRTLQEWREANGYLETCAAVEKARRLAFMEAALADGQSWIRIGLNLDQTATAARRYYNRNKVEV